MSHHLQGGGQQPIQIRFHFRSSAPPVAGSEEVQAAAAGSEEVQAAAAGSEEVQAAAAGVQVCHAGSAAAPTTCTMSHHLQGGGQL